MTLMEENILLRKALRELMERRINPPISVRKQIIIDCLNKVSKRSKYYKFVSDAIKHIEDMEV